MKNLIIDKTASTPSIRFNAETGVLEIKGESYPENVAKIYSPVLDWLKDYLASETKTFEIQFDIPFFNSSTSKVLLMILDMLEEGVGNGKAISAKWLCEQENELAIECGLEFKEDLEKLPFEIELYEQEEDDG